MGKSSGGHKGGGGRKGGRTPVTPADAARIQSFGAKHPSSPTARSGWPSRAQSSAAATGPTRSTRADGSNGGSG